MPSEPTAPPEIQVIMPVHNEAASIGQTLREWHAELSPRVAMALVVTEDGSRDNTKTVLADLAKELPLQLDMTDARRGYAGAVVAAFRHTTAPYVLAVDSDGQCDPKDFWAAWERRKETDVVTGWRVNRNDSLVRKIMSRAFGALHRALFATRLHDPSCPYVLISRPVLDRLLPTLGTCTEGFWWEFTGRAKRAGFTIAEVPINHRKRTAGGTVVFRPAKIPRIALRNGLGLLKVWWQTR